MPADGIERQPNYAIGRLEGALNALQATVDRQTEAISALTTKFTELSTSQALTAQTLEGMKGPVTKLNEMRHKIGGIMLVLAVISSLVVSVINPAIQIFFPHH